MQSSGQRTGLWGDIAGAFLVTMWWPSSTRLPLESWLQDCTRERSSMKMQREFFAALNLPKTWQRALRPQARLWLFKSFPAAKGLSPADEGIGRWQNLLQMRPHWWREVTCGMPLDGYRDSASSLILVSASCPPGGEQL